MTIQRIRNNVSYSVYELKELKANLIDLFVYSLFLSIFVHMI